MASWLKKQVSKLFNREDRRAKNNIKVEHYELRSEPRTEEWEKQFQEHSNFDFVQNGKTYNIVLHFRATETRKEEIERFVKDGMKETGGNLTMVIINVNLIYGLGAATRGVQEENKILLFFAEP